MLDVIDPKVEARVRDSFSKQGLMQHLGVKIVEVAPGMVRLQMPFKEELTQHYGYFHAGGTSSIADTAGGYAGYSLMNEGDGILTVEFKINLLAAAQGDYLEAIGKVIKSGRTLTITQIDVWAVSEEKRVHIAMAQQTLMSLAGMEK